jgi:hypothetical protein
MLAIHANSHSRFAKPPGEGEAHGEVLPVGPQPDAPHVRDIETIDSELRLVGDASLCGSGAGPLPSSS